MPYTREQVLQLQASARVYQAEWDEAFQPWGFRAPAPVIGQLPNDYDRNMAVLAKKQLPADNELKRMQFRAMPDDAYQALRPQLQKACKDSAYRPDAAAVGELREIITTDPRNGYKEHRFVGQQHFISLPNFGTGIPIAGGPRPGRRVISFGVVRENLANYNRSNERMRQV